MDTGLLLWWAVGIVNSMGVSLGKLQEATHGVTEGLTQRSG